jgi:hypothetical protein
MKRKKIFRISGTADANNESSKNTNVKSEINKLSTNKRCHFLEIIAPINETLEQKQNGYCNVDFVDLDTDFTYYAYDVGTYVVCCTSGRELQFIVLLMMGAESARNI